MAFIQSQRRGFPALAFIRSFVRVTVAARLNRSAACNGSPFLLRASVTTPIESNWGILTRG
jgi:hypothetical protein